MNIKELVGRYSANYVKSGMIVGLGTGSTANYFIRELGRRIQLGELTDIVAVATSRQSEKLALSLEIPMVNLDDVNEIDLLIDGADEVTRQFTGIKGGGGSHLHEKIVAQYSKEVIWIVTEDKVVETLGKFPLAVEIVPFGSWKTFRVFEQAGMNPKFRKSGESSFFITDSGNYLVDLQLGEIQAPMQLAADLEGIVGVIDHGLFLHYCDRILVGKSDGGIQVLIKESGGN